MTVGELRQLLLLYRDNTPVLISIGTPSRSPDLVDFTTTRGRTYTSAQGKHSKPTPATPPVYKEALILNPEVITRAPVDPNDEPGEQGWMFGR